MAALAFAHEHASAAAASDDRIRPRAGLTRAGALADTSIVRTLAAGGRCGGAAPLTLRRQRRDSAHRCLGPASGEHRGSLEIVDDLAGARPMLGWDHEKDVPSTETVERVIGHAACFNADRSQVITPSHRRLLVLECADRLPALHARVADQNGLFLGDATVLEARDPHITSVRPELSSRTVPTRGNRTFEYGASAWSPLRSPTGSSPDRESGRAARWGSSALLASKGSPNGSPTRVATGGEAIRSPDCSDAP